MGMQDDDGKSTGAKAGNLVPETIRGLLCSLAYGWTPSLPSLGAVDQVWFGDRNLSELAPSVHMDGERLLVAFDASGARNKLDELMPFDLKSTLRGSLKSGGSFEVQWISRLQRGGGFSEKDGIRADLRVETEDWMILSGGGVPSTWVGQLAGFSKISHGGNLVIERFKPGDIRGGRRGHFRLQGAYLYYLVRSVTDGGWWLVADTGTAGAPDRELLGRDLLTLQFVFGRQLRVPLLLGLGADKDTSACLWCSPLKNRTT